LVVPRSAVLMAGDNSVVYVETEPGRFELRPVKLGPLARDTAVILEGVKEGEAVATSGNFLIDSQMQLSGKPSLIDPTRMVARTATVDGPLELAVDVQPLPGEPGQQLEQLYAAYLAIQQTLAADEKLNEAQVTPLVSTADSLLQDEKVPEAARQQMQTIRENALHLHHLEIKAAREHFRPISHAVLQLAALYRGESAEQPLIHFFCPMVKGGGGDWLQNDRPLANPYYGSEMLRCGEEVRVLPPPVEPASAEAATDGISEE
jgi:membrane fusion protein, copper/silver efflux system